MTYGDNNFNYFTESQRIEMSEKRTSLMLYFCHMQKIFQSSKGGMAQMAQW